MRHAMVKVKWENGTVTEIVRQCEDNQNPVDHFNNEVVEMNEVIQESGKGEPFTRIALEFRDITREEFEKIVDEGCRKHMERIRKQAQQNNPA